MTAPKVAGVIAPEKPTLPPDNANGRFIVAMEGLTNLSKLKPKDRKTLLKLALAIQHCRNALQLYSIYQDLLLERWAKRDEAGTIQVVTSSDGKHQAPLFENEVHYTLDMNRLMREPSTLAVDFPPPFTWEELTEKFITVPDAETIAKLGPFMRIKEDV